MAKAQVLKEALSYSSWPLVFVGGLVGSYFAFTSSHVKTKVQTIDIA